MVADEPFAADHFGGHEPCAQTGCELPKGPIGHTRHGRKHKRGIDQKLTDPKRRHPECIFRFQNLLNLK
jgi:hypothetical protein